MMPTPTTPALKISSDTLRLERQWFFTITALTFVAILGHWFFPLTPERVASLLAQLGVHAHAGKHLFADARTCAGIHNAANVLSNGLFAVLGAVGLWQLRKLKVSAVLSNVQTQTLTVFFVGLVLTALGSAWYHCAPSDATLLWDRVGMAVAFAGVLGLAACERISDASGRFTLHVTLLGAALALGVWFYTGDVLPWSVVQYGGMALLLGLACLKPKALHLGVSLLTLIGFYSVSKILEISDHALFEATGQWVSGHSAKHMMASFAALPVLHALKKRGK